MINYDIPNISETYVHRIGRTGRAGARGVAFSFCEHDDLEFLRDIEKLISQKIPVIDDHPFPKQVHTKSPPKPQRQFTPRNERSEKQSSDFPHKREKGRDTPVDKKPVFSKKETPKREWKPKAPHIDGGKKHFGSKNDSPKFGKPGSAK